MVSFMVSLSMHKMSAKLQLVFLSLNYLGCVLLNFSTPSLLALALLVFPRLELGFRPEKGLGSTLSQWNLLTAAGICCCCCCLQSCSCCTNLSRCLGCHSCRGCHFASFWCSSLNGTHDEWGCRCLDCYRSRGCYFTSYWCSKLNGVCDEWGRWWLSGSWWHMPSWKVTTCCKFGEMLVCTTAVALRTSDVTDGKSQRLHPKKVKGCTWCWNLNNPFFDMVNKLSKYYALLRVQKCKKDI